MHFLGSASAFQGRPLKELTLNIHSTRERLLASSMICGMAFLGLSATQASADAQPDECRPGD
jgi:hypothetical protein